MRTRSDQPTDDLDPARILAPHTGFGTIADPVTVTVYGLVLDCPRCEQPTTAFLAFLPSGDPGWDQSRIVLCNSDLALAVAEAATSEFTHIVNAVGRPGYTAGADPDLVNRCFHCDQPLTGDDLAAQVRCTYLDGLVVLGPSHAPRRWVHGAMASAGSFVNHGDIPRPAAVPDFLTAILDKDPSAHGGSR